jgi:nitrite reductase/ring-hydroxylating ferredoxin subunit/uncharacterized membrane protein
MATSKTAVNTTHASWIETPPSSPPLRRWSGEAIERQGWLDALAEPLQNWARSLSKVPALRKLKDGLHGTWFGHPVHPAITDIPIGSWASTVLLDGFWLARDEPELARAADLTLILGLVGAGLSAATGLADWSETDAIDRRVGLAHGLLNAGALLANLLSCGLRFGGLRRAGIAVSSVGYALTLCSSYLGGELSFAKGVGVNHVAWEAGSDKFVAVMRAADLPEKKLTRVEAEGIPVVLWKDGEQIYALAATCSHAGGPLDEGTCQDGTVTCPWHGSCFRMTDGAVVSGPAVYAQPTFAVRVRKDRIELRRLEHA